MYMENCVLGLLLKKKDSGSFRVSRNAHRYRGTKNASEPFWKCGLNKKALDTRTDYDKIKLNWQPVFGKGSWFVTRKDWQIDPASVAPSMLTAVDSRGNRIFSSEDFLTASQIAGFFSRLASKKTLSAEEDHEEALVGASQEVAIQELTSAVAREFLPAHPVMWDGRNLCEMASDRKLDKLSLTQLRDICADLNIDTEGIRVKRKQPYVEKIDAYCQTCICKVTKWMGDDATIGQEEIWNFNYLLKLVRHVVLP